MSYLQGFLIPVSSGRRDDYVDLAARSWPIFRDYGATQLRECWGIDVPDGKLTSFPMAVKREQDETVVFSWMIWPDKAATKVCEASMETDERWQQFDPSQMPFDGKRMIFGGFEPLFEAGDPDATKIVVGFLQAVPLANREAYRALAEEAWETFRDNGATELREYWAVDVPMGELTSFPRALKLAEEEAVVFSWAGFPDRAAHQRWVASMETDPRHKEMSEREMPFDTKRMMWGTFEVAYSRG